MAKSLSSLLCLFGLCACAGSGQDRPALQIEDLVIENQTQMWVSAARVLVPTRGTFVSCGNISPGSMCSTSFPQTTYAGDPIEITWSQAGQIYSTGQFVMQIPDDLDSELMASVQVVIAGPGSAGAVIVQRSR